MAKDILSELFYGRIVPWENRPINIDEFRELNQKMSRVSDEMDECLGKDAKALLDQYLSDRADMEMLFSLDSFKTGLRLGIQLMVAVYKEP